MTNKNDFDYEVVNDVLSEFAGRDRNFDYNEENQRDDCDYYDELNDEISKNIEEKNFSEAFNVFDEAGYTDPLDFMVDVIKVHGADSKILNEAVLAVTEYKGESTEFSVKLLNDTLKTEHYREAFEKGQDKAQENTR